MLDSVNKVRRYYRIGMLNENECVNSIASIVFDSLEAPYKKNEASKLLHAKRVDNLEECVEHLPDEISTVIVFGSRTSWTFTDGECMPAWMANWLVYDSIYDNDTIIYNVIDF